MKISKIQQVSSSEELVSTIPTSANSARDEAIQYIESAIHVLTTVANEDQIAKESIANLAVVLVDLQS